MKKKGRGGEKREKTGREKMSGTLPACRSNMKNDVCSRCNRREGGWIQFGIRDTTSHSPQTPILHTSYVHTHIAAVNHLLQQEGYVRGFS